MKLPKTINVYGQQYKIIQDKNMRGDDIIGWHDGNVSTISIAPGLDRDEEKITFLHECFHAVFYRLSLSEGIDTSTEEIIVDCFAKFMVEHFKLELK